MEKRLIGIVAYWVLVSSTAMTCLAQRLPERERDPRTRSDEADTLIRDAIARQQADPQVTRVAEASLRSLIWWERRLGLKYGPEHLERFLKGTGGQITYGPNSQVAKWVRAHDGAQFSHRAAHELATQRIRNYLEKEIKNGRTQFPSQIPLESIGFVKNYVDSSSPGYADRLQGPTLYQSGLVFQVPTPYIEVPLAVVELIVSFGDMQGPHEGVITNLRLEKKKEKGKAVVHYEYEITYTWNDQFTFDNDANMGHYDAAAHYLEFIAKTAKPYKTSVNMKEKVQGSVVLNETEPDPSGPANPGSGNPGSGNPGSDDPGTDNPGSGNPGSGDPANPDSGEGEAGGGDGKHPGAGSGNTKLPPIKIPHPPGWGVKLK